MILAKFIFPPLSITPAHGVEVVSLPYQENIHCKEAEFLPGSFQAQLNGAYRGEADICFNLARVIEFSFEDAETGEIFGKWQRVMNENGEFEKRFQGCEL